jgi:hypothetical protein
MARRWRTGLKRNTSRHIESPVFELIRHRRDKTLTVPETCVKEELVRHPA